MKNQYIEENCLKRGLGQFADLRGLTKKKGVFLRAVDTPVYIMMVLEGEKRLHSVPKFF